MIAQLTEFEDAGADLVLSKPLSLNLLDLLLAHCAEYGSKTTIHLRNSEQGPDRSLRVKFKSVIQ